MEIFLNPHNQAELDDLVKIVQTHQQWTTTDSERNNSWKKGKFKWWKRGKLNLMEIGEIRMMASVKKMKMCDPCDSNSTGPSEINITLEICLSHSNSDMFLLSHLQNHSLNGQHICCACMPFSGDDKFILL